MVYKIILLSHKLSSIVKISKAQEYYLHASMPKIYMLCQQLASSFILNEQCKTPIFATRCADDDSFLCELGMVLCCTNAIKKWYKVLGIIPCPAHEATRQVAKSSTKKGNLSEMYVHTYYYYLQLLYEASWNDCTTTDVKGTRGTTKALQSATHCLREPKQPSGTITH